MAISGGLPKPSDDRPWCVLVTKIGLDGHDRGSRIVAAYLRDAGMEVIYTPPWQTIDAVVAAAIDEDVDVIVAAASDGITHGEIVACLRRELGFGHPRIVV